MSMYFTITGARFSEVVTEIFVALVLNNDNELREHCNGKVCLRI